MSSEDEFDESGLRGRRAGGDTQQGGGLCGLARRGSCADVYLRCPKCPSGRTQTVDENAREHWQRRMAGAHGADKALARIEFSIARIARIMATTHESHPAFEFANQELTTWLQRREQRQRDLAEAANAHG